MAKKPLLVDRFGKPMAYSDFFQAGSLSVRREQPWRYYYAGEDTDKLLTKGSWYTVLSAARFLFANVDIIRGALLEQASYSFPLHTRYTGEDKVWGRKVGEPWLNEWRRTANFRGGPYDATAMARVRMLGYKVDGDIGTVLTLDETEYPRLQYVRAHRIGTRETTDRFRDGKYKGLRVQNGIIIDDYNRPVAVQILGDKPEEDQYIPARGFILTYRPDYSDQSRGISHLVATIRPQAAIKRLFEYELRAHQVQSSYAVTRKSSSGEADAASEAVIQGSRNGVLPGGVSTLTAEVIQDGLINYISAANGEEIILESPDRPGGGSQEFWATIIRGALYGAGWDPDFALSLKAPGGAWARTIIGKICRTIEDNVATEALAQRREDFYAINLAIAKKRIPGPKDGNTWSWEYQLGQELPTADSGNDLAAKREDYKLGVLNLSELLAGRGTWWTNHREQRSLELQDLLERASALRKDWPELSLQECLNLLEMRNPNGVTATMPVASHTNRNCAAKARDGVLPGGVSTLTEPTEPADPTDKTDK